MHPTCLVTTPTIPVSIRSLVRAACLLWIGFFGLTACAEPADQTTSGQTNETPVSQLPPATVQDTLASGNPVDLSRGQTLYVPIYSHIHFRNKDRVIDLAATVSIRNTDPEHPIVLSAIDYFDNSGELVRQYLDKPRQLGPLASTSVVIEEADASGGLGANFIVQWSSSQPVHPPVVEAIMISTRSALGISFTSPARVLHERSD